MDTPTGPDAGTPTPLLEPPHDSAEAGWTDWLHTVTPQSGPTQPAEPSDTEDEGVTAPPGDEPPAAAGGRGDDTSSTDTRRVPRPVRGRAVAAAGAALVAALAGAGLLVVAGSRSGDTTAAAAPTPPPAATTAEPASAAAGAWCPAVDDGETVSGSGAGNAATGAGLVFALQYRMYAARDLDGVRALFAPSATVAPVEATREAIATIPPGTRHCVRVRTVAPDRFAVAVTELHPDRTTQLWETTVTTGAQSDGRTLITAITPGTAP